MKQNCYVLEMMDDSSKQSPVCVVRSLQGQALCFVDYSSLPLPLVDLFEGSVKVPNR